MGKNSQLRQEIISCSTHLFRTKGVKATTIKLIASDAGCTNAALYYYFEGGKTQILEEVLNELLSKKLETFERLNTNQSFADFIRQIGQTASRDFGDMTSNISWLIVEYDSLSKDLQLRLHQHLMKGHDILTQCLCNYLQDERTASHIAWMLFCTFFGYSQVFTNLNLAISTDFTTANLTEAMAAVMAANKEIAPAS